MVYSPRLFDPLPREAIVRYGLLYDWQECHPLAANRYVRLGWIIPSDPITGSTEWKAVCLWVCSSSQEYRYNWLRISRMKRLCTPLVGFICFLLELVHVLLVSILWDGASAFTQSKLRERIKTFLLYVPFKQDSRSNKEDRILSVTESYSFSRTATIKSSSR